MTTSGQVPPLQTFAPHQRESVWSLRMIWRAMGPTPGGFSVESGFEPAALRSRVETLPLGNRALFLISDYLMKISTSMFCIEGVGLIINQEFALANYGYIRTRVQRNFICLTKCLA
ncbi:hypothetical protein AVEN_239221-1 [Araneus ventricosus]|uniref:Uncharacterized protein n=1 Tax=Araneus ventricosus TaxID=182803 RepID=A0A4Y2JLB4_ARAVE|nr:hypothetical protein AVEN_239221-1 [Araneus ventricosus]